MIRGLSRVPHDTAYEEPKGSPSVKGGENVVDRGPGGARQTTESEGLAYPEARARIVDWQHLP